MSGLEHPWSIEERCFAEGCAAVCGVDEAGAGPLAGPVYAAAVILPRGILLEGLNDSKKLSPKKRDGLFDRICLNAEEYAVSFASVEEIEALNILNARLLAMQRAIDALKRKPDFALIDGDRDHGGRCAVATPHRTVVHGDGKSASIAAASILAKVSRDRYVTEVLDPQYPQYQFARHKGYGTRLHYELLDRYGPCPAHRKSFLKKWESGRK
jgi:ribonuclease HII